jgi:regulator of protease activity HflC (stomatin/prohibitin superfamily)
LHTRTLAAMHRAVARIYAHGSAGAPKHARPFFTVIPQRMVAFRETLGKGRTLLAPGLHWDLPFVHQTTRVSTREESVPVIVEAYTRDNVPVHVEADVFFRVTDAELACFAVQDRAASTQKVAASAVRTVMGGVEYDAIIRQRSELTAALVTEISPSVEVWGIACCKVEVGAFRPQNAGVAKALEAQMDAERARRKNELDTKARVNTAEGEKRAVELEAEGRALATRVAAEAARFATEQAAEADKYAVQKRGEALAAEVAALAAAFGGDAGAASAFLVEQGKLRHLQAIAGAGAHTNTYFVPDAASLLPSLAVTALRDHGTASTQPGGKVQ